MADGSYLAFFEVPDMPFEFKAQHDYDLHIALEVDAETLQRMFELGRERGIETRGIVDHGFLRSIYFRDPDGYVIELTARTVRHDADMNPATNAARATLDAWTAERRGERTTP
jgi:catechol-2,3-dioxygenase